MFSIQVHLYPQLKRESLVFLKEFHWRWQGSNTQHLLSTSTLYHLSYQDLIENEGYTGASIDLGPTISFEAQPRVY